MSEYSEYLEILKGWFPPVTPDTLWFYILLVLILYAVLSALQMLLVLLVNKSLGKKSRPYSRGSGLEARRILILGDSTAVGTGADRPQDTIAGRLAYDFPDSQIVNLGQNGGLIGHILIQLKKVEGQKFDMIVISAGGNDIINFTQIKKIWRDLQEILSLTKMMCEHRVFFLLYLNMGVAPLFPALFQYILQRRGRKLYAEIRKVCERERVPVIEIFASEQESYFIKNPERYFAKDRIHPSSEGYRVWYNRMWRAMSAKGLYYARHGADVAERLDS